MEQKDETRVVRAVIDALNRRDRGALQACVAPDAEWRVDGISARGAAPRRGHAEVWALVERLDREFERLSVGLDEVMPVGAETIVPLRMTGRGRRTGARLQMELILRCRVERGRLVAAVGHRSLPDALRTLLRREPSRPLPARAA